MPKQRKDNVILPKKKKRTIPNAIREQVWIRHNLKNFEACCYIYWCTNSIDVFNFHVGHDIPESKGGTLDLNNLYPICGKCNRSMSNNYTIVSPIDGLPNMIGVWNEISISKEVEMEIVEQCCLYYHYGSIFLYNIV